MRKNDKLKLYVEDNGNITCFGSIIKLADYLGISRQYLSKEVINAQDKNQTRFTVKTRYIYFTPPELSKEKRSALLPNLCTHGIH